MSYNPKVSNPTMSNDIPQMRSGDFQPPFYAGGNQTPYYLGLKGNSATSSAMPTGVYYSATEQLIKERRRK
jgi:hypothetical protein